MLAPIERGVTDACDRIRNCYRRKKVASTKRRVCDGCNGIWNSYIDGIAYILADNCLLFIGINKIVFRSYAIDCLRSPRTTFGIAGVYNVFYVIECIVADACDAFGNNK